MSFLKMDLEGKVRNLPSFKTEALLPVFEAIVNSIHAIEDRKFPSIEDGRISIEVNREDAGLFGENEIRPVVGFVITDNGIGFNESNFSSFETSDSTYKKERGGKGIGRLLWLKAFDSVYVSSVYVDSASQRRHRKFAFNTKDGIKEDSNTESSEDQATTVYLNGFKDEYRRLPTAYKTPSKIAQRILEHCLSYFISGAAPSIVVIDQDEQTSLNALFSEDIKNNVVNETLKIEGQVFSLAHMRLYGTHDKMHNMALCANGRDVKGYSLSSVLGTGSQFDNESDKFTYALYVTSPYLDQHVSSHRMGFEIPDEPSLFSLENSPSLKQVVSKVSDSAREHLKDILQVTRSRKEEIVANYIANENPSLRAVPHYCPEVYDEIEPNSSPEKINEVLYRYKGRAEFSIRKQSAELLKTQNKSLEEMSDIYEKLTEKITDFQKDNLVNYLCDRKRVIALLEKKLELNSDGKFSNEDIVHDIIFPRKTTTDHLSFENHNLWIIDENLTFHNFAASDKPLNQIMDSESEERPDIVAFAEIDEDKIARAVSIIEFKKPQRTAFDEDPTRQLYRYLREIRGVKKVKLPNGRDLNVSENTRFYCYAICDITPAIRTYTENVGQYAELKGELGFYMYNKALNAHTEILAFDKIVVDVKRRHRAFFEKLGISDS